jgi:hypothetical protein
MEPLKGPISNRKVTSIKAPPSLPLDSELIWYKKKNPGRLKRSSKLEDSQGPYEKGGQTPQRGSSQDNRVGSEYIQLTNKRVKVTWFSSKIPLPLSETFTVSTMIC